jgi:predicted nucleic acid-binding protein
VRLFLDSSVVLAACGRSSGASRLIVDLAASQGWELHTSAYVLNEVSANVSRLGAQAAGQWTLLQPRLNPVPDIVSFPWITVFPAAKDRPVLFTATAWSDVLLTLDRRDFSEMIGTQFYALAILKPGEFLRQQRDLGHWVDQP